MADTIQEYTAEVTARDGTSYRVRAVGERRRNVWVGWLEFEPRGGGRKLRTGEETSQPDRDAVAYWASGLEAVYFEGALLRAK